MDSRRRRRRSSSKHCAQLCVVIGLPRRPNDLLNITGNPNRVRAATAIAAREQQQQRLLVTIAGNSLMCRHKRSNCDQDARPKTALNAAPVAAAAARPKPKSMLLLLLLLATCAGAVVGLRLLPGCLDWPAPLVSGLFCTLDE